MKSLFLAVVLAMLGSPACADISDSGGLTIGGNGVIQGTFTVQGAAPFSIVSSSGIQILQGGLIWPDGTTSYTASGGGAGNVVLTATQTFSGANTFLSSVTFMSAVYTSTATTGAGATQLSGALVGSWQIVASTNPYFGGYSTAPISISGLQPDRIYRLIIRGIKSGASGVLNMRINGVSSSAYKWSDADQNSGAAGSYNWSNSATSCRLNDFDPVDGSGNLTVVDFTTMPGSPTKTMITWSSFTSQTAGNTAGSETGQCFFSDSNLANLSIYFASGGFRGYVYLMQLMTQLP